LRDGVERRRDSRTFASHSSGPSPDDDEARRAGAPCAAPEAPAHTAPPGATSVRRKMIPCAIGAALARFRRRITDVLQETRRAQVDQREHREERREHEAERRRNCRSRRPSEPAERIVVDEQQHTVIVEFAGPPEVKRVRLRGRTCAVSDDLQDHRHEQGRPRSCGTVMCQIFRQIDAPSTDAALIELPGSRS